MTTTTDGQYVPSDSEEWELVDLLGTIIEDANDEPQFTVSEHALMAAGTIRREWLAAHDTRVRRDAARGALDGLIAWHRENAQDAETPAPIRHGVAVMADEAQRYRDTHYSEGDDQ